MTDVTNGAAAPSADTSIADAPVTEHVEHRQSIEEQLRASFDKADAEASEADDKSKDKPQTRQSAAPDRARGSDGKFIPAGDAAGSKPAKETATTPDPATAVTPVSPPAPDATAMAASTTAGDAPTSWSKEAKAIWSTLPPVVQTAALKREKEISDGFAQKTTELQRFKDLDAVMAPRRASLQQAGLSDAQAIAQVWSWHDKLSHQDMATRYQNAAQFLGSYGINLNPLAQAPQGQGLPQNPPQLDLSGYIAPVQQQVQTLAQTVKAIQDERLQADLNSFANAKDASGVLLHPFYDDAKSAMATLLNKGLVTDLETAYQKAIRFDDALAQKIQDSKAAAELKKVQDADAERQRQAQAQVTNARRASVSVRGGPPTTAVANSKSKGKSVEDNLREAYAEAEARA